jgi:hypothetical protein
MKLFRRYFFVTVVALAAMTTTTLFGVLEANEAFPRDAIVAEGILVVERATLTRTRRLTGAHASMYARLSQEASRVPNANTRALADVTSNRLEAADHEVMSIGWPLRWVETRILYSDDGARTHHCSPIWRREHGAKYTTMRTSEDQQMFCLQSGWAIGEAAFVVPYDVRFMWLGINMLCFVTPLWLLVFGLRTVVVHRRRLAGRCLDCGYVLDGLAQCAECGVTVTRSR